MLVGCPKLPEQAKNQKSSWPLTRAPQDSLSKNFSSNSPHPNGTSTAAPPLARFLVAFRKPLSSETSPDAGDAVSSESDGALWVLWWALHNVALAAVNFSFFLFVSLSHARIIAQKRAAGPAPTPTSRGLGHVKLFLFSVRVFVARAHHCAEKSGRASTNSWELVLALPLTCTQTTRGNVSTDNHMVLKLFLRSSTQNAGASKTKLTG
jgi:hypothetical protein